MAYKVRIFPLTRKLERGWTISLKYINEFRGLHESFLLVRTIHLLLVFNFPKNFLSAFHDFLLLKQALATIPLIPILMRQGFKKQVII